MGLFQIGLITALLFIFLQDLKYRKIHVVLPVLVLCFSIVITGFTWPHIINAMTNLGFFAVTLCVLTIYMSLRRKAFLNPFTHYFGLGDLLFYVAIAPLFLLYNYILYFIFSMAFALIMQAFFKRWISVNSVPLAGLSAILLTALLIKDLFMPYAKITLIH